MTLASQQKDVLETAILDYANKHEDRDYDYRLHMACRKFRIKFYDCERGAYYLFDPKMGRRICLSQEPTGLQWVRGWESKVSDYGLAPIPSFIAR